MLHVEHLSLRYSGNMVVRDVSFTLRPGEIVAYLGANGAGKTTTVKALIGLMQPRRGRILYDGRDVADDLTAWRARIGYVPETADVYPFLSGLEYLELCGHMRALPDRVVRSRSEALLALVGLESQRDQPLSAYSKGMRQKVLICAALLHDPVLLVLDEPLSGLDVTTVMVLKALLRRLAARGRIVLYSTHMLEIAENLCERVLILHRGLIVADDSVANLREMSRRPSLEAVFAACVGAEGPEQTAERILDVVSGSLDPGGPRPDASAR